MKNLFYSVVFVFAVLFAFWCLGEFHAGAYNVEGIWVSQNRPAVGSWAFDGVNKYTWQEDSVDVVDTLTGNEYCYDFEVIEIDDYPYEAYEDDDWLDEYGNIWWED